MPASATTTVYFDGSCPLCRREIAVYRRAVPATPIDWVDVSTGNSCDIDGRNCRDLLARFHVRTAEGRMLSGAAAFVALWLLFPGWRWLGRFGSLPGMRAVLEVAYRGFLRVRPRVQRLVKRLEAGSK
jgi:predicted DCC family thiol-disulfide oxidoreductase YuxK